MDTVCILKAIWNIYGYLVYFMAFTFILWSFWFIFSVLVCCTEEDLATPDTGEPMSAKCLFSERLKSGPKKL
jgi:hypothetical protein